MFPVAIVESVLSWCVWWVCHGESAFLLVGVQESCINVSSSPLVLVALVLHACFPVGAIAL